MYWCNVWTCFNVKKKKLHNFSYTVQYCSSSLPSLSKTHRILQNPSYWKAQCALIGQLIQCIVIGQCIGNVTALTTIESFSFHSKSIMSSVLPYQSDSENAEDQAEQAWLQQNVSQVYVFNLKLLLFRYNVITLYSPTAHTHSDCIVLEQCCK